MKIGQKVMEAKNKSEPQATMSNTDLAFERTVLAQERTLMAWIRTAISLISFGFTMYKFFEELSKSGERGILTPRLVGMVMIAFGFIALLFAKIQHNIALKKLKKEFPDVQRSLSSVLSTLILVFGLILFLGALFRQ